MNARRLYHLSRVSVLLGAILALTACASHAPVHYYTLVGPSAAASAAGPIASFDIDVLPVTVPAALHRRAMVLRTGATQLMVQDNHQWAAPLPEALRAALSADLVAGLGTRDLAGLSAVGAHRDGADVRPVYGVVLVVQRFEAVYGDRVTLAGVWSLRDAGGRTLLTCTGRATQPASGGYARLAEAAQQALATVASQIGTALRAMPGASCPVTVAAPKAGNG